MSYHWASRADPGLPSIRRSGLVETAGSRGLTSLDDTAILADRTPYHVRFSPSAPPAVYYNGHRAEDSAFYPRPPSPTHNCRRQHVNVTDVHSHDPERFYKAELAKRDRLIGDLTRHDTPRQRVFDTAPVDDLYSTDRICSAACRSQVAALRVKTEGFQSQIRELQAQLEVREDKNRELKLQLDATREAEANQSVTVSSLRQRLLEYEERYGSLEGAATRSSIAVKSLQLNNQDAHDRIMELESRIKALLEEKEMVQQDRGTADRRMTEFVSLIQGIFCAEDLGSFDSTEPDFLIPKIKDMIQENALLRGKLTTMKEYLSSAELENKASRETIMRLVSETEREHKSASRYTLEMDTLRLDRDNAVAHHRDLERENQLLQERLESSQRSLAAGKKELDDRHGHYGNMDREIRERDLAARNVEQQYRSFKESLAGLMTDSFHAVEPFEEAIRDRIKQLVLLAKDKSSHIDMLENKVTQLSEQLAGQMEMVRAAERKSKRAQADLCEVDDHLRQRESELAAGDVLRDGLRVDKERYLRFLERVSGALRMEPITADVGLDMATDAIIARGEQLTHQESDGLNDRKTHIYNLQRKCKSLKEQLNSKELHMELLRKKVGSLEERMLGKTDLEREKDDGFVKNRKLLKLVERYKHELTEARFEITSLKAQLLEGSGLRNRTMEQERELENLETKVGQLEHVRQRQSRKIAHIKNEIDEKDGHMENTRGVTQNTIQALTSELRTTKLALDEITQRERQLLDLRQVVARMLGLDVNSLAVPDFEIISRLEKLILANQSNASTAVALDNVLGDMEEGFRAGYNDAGHAILAASAPRARSPTRRAHKHTNLRSRSLSPRHRRDQRAY